MRMGEGSSETTRTGPLVGLRVLDLTRGRAGALAGMLLADYGADLLRVEPSGGDPLWDDLPGYPVWHRGKRIVEMDLGDPRAVRALGARLAVADVLLESAPPGRLARFGLDPGTVRAAAPGIVHVSISAYGQTGPCRDRPGYDALVQARAGVHGHQGGSRGRPVFCTYPSSSVGAACLAVLGLLAALERRRREGGRGGEHVETSLLDGILVQSTMFVIGADRPGPAFSGPSRVSGVAPTMSIYRCGDGNHLHIQTGSRGALDRLFEATGLRRDDFVGPRTGRHFAGDPEGASRFRAALSAVFASRPRDEWIARLSRADVPAAPCLEPGAGLRHPQTAAIGMAVAIDDPLLGRVVQAGLPMRFSDTPGRVSGAATRLGRTPNPEAALRHAGWPTAGEMNLAPRVSEVGDPCADSLRNSGPGAAPLVGLRVLDFGMFAAGPFAAMLLADLGADVIKIEPPEGDTMRPMVRNFPGLHRGKRGLALDLKSPGATPIVERLVRDADVVIHNLRPGVAERLGIGAGRLRELNPRLIYCHNTAYGSTGPMASLGGFDQMYQAFCGMEVFQAGLGNAPEQIAGAPLDCGNAMLSAIGILMALHRRAVTGVGQHLECPQLAAGLFAMSDVYDTPDGLSRLHHLDAEQRGYGPGYRLYEVTDGWIFVCCPDGEARDRFTAEFGEDADRVLGAVPGGVALERLARIDVPAEAVREALDETLLGEDWIAASGRVVSVPHPEFGVLRQFGAFVRLSSGTPAPSRPAPGLGQHTEEILAEIGFSEAEIAGWIDAGVVVRGAVEATLDSGVAPV